MGLVRFFARLFALRIVLKAVFGKGGSSGVSTPQQQDERRPPRSGNGGDGHVDAQRSNDPGGPDTPLDLAPSDWKETAKRTLKEIKDDRVTLVAAGMAYYMFLAIFPALIAAIAILGLLEVNTDPITGRIQETLPGGSGQMLVDAVDQADNPSEEASLVAAIVGIVVALWSTSSGFVAMQSGLNVAYDVKRDRKFIKARGIALLLIIATGLLGGVPSPIFTFGKETIFQVIGWVLTVVAVVVLFSLYYYFGPNREKPTWQWVSAGGLVGAAIWIIASIGFGIYAGEPTRYEETYGSLGAVIALIFWLFLTSVSILIGGELNAELERQAEARKQRENA